MSKIFAEPLGAGVDALLGDEDEESLMPPWELTVGAVVPTGGRGGAGSPAAGAGGVGAPTAPGGGAGGRELGNAFFEAMAGPTVAEMR